MLRKVFLKILYLLPLFLIICLCKSWYIASLGFKMAKISPGSFLFYTWQKNISCLTEEKRDEVLTILDQPFYFLGRGQQAYAFESADGQYVIKFLRMPKYNPPFWIKLPLLPVAIAAKGEMVSCRRDSFWKSCQRSVSLAEKELKNEMGLIFCHLEQTDDMQKFIVIHDRLKVAHTVDLDRYAFILQRKMEPIAPYLLDFYEKNDHEEIQKTLTSFKEAITYRSNKKIRNKNRNCMRNMGIMDGKVQEFDVGELRLDPTIDNIVEMQKSTKQLKKWLEVNMPEFASSL